MTAKTETPTGLDLLRAPFPDNLISKLPKATKAQNDALREDFKKGVRCKLCGGWHLPDVVHLDYVGHAALTHRLLDADPAWNWEPLAFSEYGLPLFDQSGGLWIKLTVCGQSRLGYGHAAGKPNSDPGAREKEVIGDALRNAAMRFGAALDLWHKGDLHVEGDDAPKDDAHQGDDNSVEFINDDQADWLINMLEQHNIPPARLLKAAGVRTISMLPGVEFEKAKSWVNAAVAEKTA